MKAGEAATFRCLDGTVWICTNVSKNSTTDNHGKQFFVTSGVFTVPEGVSTVQVTMCGGGGGSGSSGYEGGSGGGGGAAGAFKEIVTNLISGSEITVTVGAGGAGGTAVEENGHDGGASSFGSYLTRSGGKGSGYGWTVYPGLGGASGGGIYCTAGSNGTKTDGGKGGSSLIDYLTTNIGGGGYNNLFYYLMAKCFWTYTYGTGANGRIGLKSDNNSAGEGNPGYSGFVLVEW
jgi:hypothetical protein